MARSEKEEEAVIFSFVQPLESVSELYSLRMLVETDLYVRGEGRYDGHEVFLNKAGGKIYLYGPNAHDLYLTVKHTVQSFGFMADSDVTLRSWEKDGNITDVKFTL